VTTWAPSSWRRLHKALLLAKVASVISYRMKNATAARWYSPHSSGTSNISRALAGLHHAGKRYGVVRVQCISKQFYAVCQASTASHRVLNSCIQPSREHSLPGSQHSCAAFWCC
jgi:hypothetical protein